MIDKSCFLTPSLTLFIEEGKVAIIAEANNPITEMTTNNSSNVNPLLFFEALTDITYFNCQTFLPRPEGEQMEEVQFFCCSLPKNEKKEKKQPPIRK